MTGLIPYFGQTDSAIIKQMSNAKNRKLLPWCMKFEQFDNLSSDSFKNHIIDQVYEIKGVFHESTLNSPIQLLVSELLTNTMGFLEELFN